MKKSRLLILCMVFIISACSSDKLFYRNASFEVEQKQYDSPINYSVYLVGDAGGDTSKSKYALDLLTNKLENSDANKTAAVFLGDNIYPEGLHKKGHELRGQDTARINAQIDAVKDFNGELFFIPGNHDWKKGKEDGLAFVKRQEKYVQKRLDRKVFKPSDGCSGPEEIELSDALTLIIIDTQWWLHKYEKARGEKDDCPLRTKDGFLAEFKELLKSNRNKNVIVVGHHPLYSNGVHGGYFTWKDHIFPLTKTKKNLWIPTPVIGSIYPFYRSFFGNVQDIPNPKYQELKRELVTAMNEYDNVIYAAGHEHNLQYVHENRLHHIISGSGSKKTNLRFNQKMDFGTMRNGFARIDVLENGEVKLSYFDAESKEGDIIFHKTLFQRDIKEFETQDIKKVSYANQFKVVVPDSNFSANGTKRLFFGNLNRDLWTLPLKVPYLDIHHVYGGLTPVGKGGGMQTLSLKMIGGDGYTYKLRGIKKNADFLVSKDLRGTVAQDVIYDGIAGSHPYASVAVPKFAEAAQIYYTIPQLVYVPKDSILGDYLDEFGGMFCLLEIHPDDDMSEFDNFGNSKKVLNYHKAIKKLEDHPKNQVDVDFTVRSRLLDLFLGDWDRHDDQWRWATFKENGKTSFRPIPRDRDQVFFQFDGAVMKLANRKWLLRKFQHFEEDIRDVAGLSFNARYFDRYFLTQADLKVWEEQAQKLQTLITDEVIQNALQDLPPEAQQYNAKELEVILKERRGRMVEFANRYYHILAREVDVRGTLEKDYFEVIRMRNGDVEVNVYPRKDGDKVSKKRYYHRIFKKSETKEIRLYGLDDKDEYHISGDANKSILVRIIASENKDKIEDDSKVKGGRKYTLIYDEEGKSDIELGTEAKLKIQKPEDSYVYNRKEFKYDALIPIPSIGVNPDDGFYFGPGFRFVKQGFKKKPYKYAHDFNANYALRAEGFNIRYDCEYIDLLGKFDLGGRVEINNPNVFQFYGLGNETSPEESDLGQSDVRINNYEVETRLSLSSKDLSSRLILNLGYQVMDLEEIPNVGLAFSKDVNQQFLLTGLNYQYFNADNRINPNKGVSFKAGVDLTQSTINDDVSFAKFETSISFYVPITYFKKKTTLAFRSGISTIEGDFNFYQANFLSGLNEFRGITRNRFAGKTVSYNNAEIRKSFFKVRNYIAPFDFGLLAHYDIARVWQEGQNSDKWHNSYGGGIYLNVLDFLSLVGTYSISDVDKVFNLGTKFYF